MFYYYHQHQFDTEYFYIVGIVLQFNNTQKGSVGVVFPMPKP
jgi:hypothetical protein